MCRYTVPRISITRELTEPVELLLLILRHQGSRGSSLNASFHSIRAKYDHHPFLPSLPSTAPPCRLYIQSVCTYLWTINISILTWKHSSDYNVLHENTFEWSYSWTVSQEGKIIRLSNFIKNIIYRMIWRGVMQMAYWLAEHYDMTRSLASIVAYERDAGCELEWELSFWVYL